MFTTDCFREIVNNIIFYSFSDALPAILLFSLLSLSAFMSPLVKVSNIFPISQVMALLPCCSCPYCSSTSWQFYFSSYFRNSQNISAAISGYLLTSEYLELGSSDGREDIYDMKLISYCV